MLHKKKIYQIYLIGFFLTFGGLLFIVKYQDKNIDNEYVDVRVGKMSLYSAGKSEAIGITDSNGKLVAGCHKFDCGYMGYKKDEAKDAVFILKNNRVVEIYVEGEVKIRESDTLIRDKLNYEFGILVFAMGIFISIIGYLMSRKINGE